ncbi:MAG: hypothetical protein QOC82_3606, partial [Frankiaceae bacterium]|nr:hypothetical protein [Frankiaceae bacterium]
REVTGVGAVVQGDELRNGAERVHCCPEAVTGGGVGPRRPAVGDNLAEHRVQPICACSG